MDWRKRSVVERMKTILEGHYEPDPSRSLLISMHGVGSENSEDELYWHIYFLVFPPPRLGVSFGPSNLGGGFVDVLQEAINEMSLPGNVRVETIDDNSWRLGRLHGMRQVKYEKSVAERCLEAFLLAVSKIVQTGIGIFINLHLLVTVTIIGIAATVQNNVLTATIISAAIPLVIQKDKDWRLLQKQRLATLVYRKDEWPEREAEYQKRLCDKCSDPDEWAITKAFVHHEILRRLFGKPVKQFNEWNASRRPSIRLARMGVANSSS